MDVAIFIIIFSFLCADGHRHITGSHITQDRIISGNPLCCTEVADTFFGTLFCFVFLFPSPKSATVLSRAVPTTVIAQRPHYPRRTPTGHLHPLSVMLVSPVPRQEPRHLDHRRKVAVQHELLGLAVQPVALLLREVGPGTGTARGNGTQERLQMHCAGAC